MGRCAGFALCSDNGYAFNGYVRWMAIALHRSFDGISEVFRRDQRTFYGSMFQSRYVFFGPLLHPASLRGKSVWCQYLC